MIALVIVAALTVGAAALAIADRHLVVNAPVPEPTAWFVPVQIGSAVIWMAASLSLRQRRDLLWSPLASVVAVSHAVAAAAYAWAAHGLVGGDAASGAAVAAGIMLWMLPIEMPVSIYMVVSLPTGRLGRTGLDRAGLVAVSMATAGVLAAMISVPDAAGTDFSAARNPLSPGLDTGPMAALLIAPAAVLSLGVLVAKWRRSSGADRLALRWVVWVDVAGTILVVPLIAVAPPAVGIGIAQVAGAVGLLVLVTVIRRQHLLGVERLFERTLRFVLLAGSLALVYVVVVAVGTELIGGGARPLAAAAVALAVLPLRDQLDRVARRFVYGDSPNADEIVGGVADRVAGAVQPADLVGQFIEDLVAGTGSAGASVELEGHGLLAAVGEPPAGPGSVRVPLRHRGVEIGQLTVAPPPGEQCLDDVSERVVAAVAPHIAIVADASRTDIELRAARGRLIEAREEERRRLRHDLHDGLGPILTGAAFSADAASNMVERDRAEAARLISSVRRDVGTALDEVRRIVEELRPPALDELGLAGAIDQHAQRFPDLEVTTTGDGSDRELPAAVEVAAYRIATEALTNVARHAAATRATVDVSCNGALALIVTDNGQGVDSWSPGVGLMSMQERARELGGEFRAGPGPDGGVVVLHLPTAARPSS